MTFHKEVKIGELLRNKLSREVWIVVDRTAQGLMVVNLMIKNDPADIHMILPAYSHNWERDRDIDDLDEWEALTLNKKMPIIDSVEKIEEDSEADTGELIEYAPDLKEFEKEFEEL